MRAAADTICVCEQDGAVWIGIGYDAEDEPREWFGMDPREALAVVRNLQEAAAIAAEHET